MYKQVSEVIRDYKVLEDQQRQVIQALHALDRGVRWAEELPKFETKEEVIDQSGYMLRQEQAKSVAYINLIEGYYQLKKEMIALGELKIKNHTEGTLYV